MRWKLWSGLDNAKKDQALRQADLVTVLIFFGYVLLVENILVFLWAWATAGTAPGPNEAPFSFSGIVSVALLCSGAASFAGGLIGFLFGIPRSNEGSSETNASAVKTVVRDEAEATVGVEVARQRATAVNSGAVPSGLRRNTNLETISDGLTKALLGIGVSQLYRAPEAFNALAEALGPAFGPGASGEIVGMAVVLYGAGAGFFFGYLGTRIYLTAVFGRNDPGQ